MLTRKAKTFSMRMQVLWQWARAIIFVVRAGSTPNFGNRSFDSACRLSLLIAAYVRRFRYSQWLRKKVIDTFIRQESRPRIPNKGGHLSQIARASVSLVVDVTFAHGNAPAAFRPRPPLNIISDCIIIRLENLYACRLYAHC